MKSLAIIATTILLTANTLLPAAAEPANNNKPSAAVQTSNDKAHAVRFFHAKKKLALRSGAADSTQTAEPGKSAGGNLDYNTDSFIIN